MNNADVIAAAVDYWRTKADMQAATIDRLNAIAARCHIERDEARHDADMWHDEAHRLRLEVDWLRALIADIKADRDQWQHKAVNAWHDHTPSSLT